MKKIIDEKEFWSVVTYFLGKWKYSTYIHAYNIFFHHKNIQCSPVPCCPLCFKIICKILKLLTEYNLFHPFFRFEVPIAFQQTNRPVPVVYSLNTEFQLTNNEKMFLLDPQETRLTLDDLDYSGAFSKGKFYTSKDKKMYTVSWHLESTILMV